MARNIEIKARINDLESCLQKAASFAKQKARIIRQEDFFFPCEQGRLKFRVFSDDRGELIFYKRDNTLGPKTSDYHITKTDEPRQLLKVLSEAHGIAGVVKKIRHLFITGRTRIHLDSVEGLGDLIEFEVVMEDGEDLKTGQKEARELMERFAIQDDDLIDCAYVDLMK